MRTIVTKSSAEIVENTNITKKAMDVYKLLLSNIESKPCNEEMVISSASPLASCEALSKDLVNIDKKYLNVTDGYGWSLLHYAAARNNPEAIKLLVKYGADTEIKDSDGQTPLYTAVVSNYVDSVKALVESGANVDTVDNLGDHLLYIASIKKNPELDRVLSIEERKKNIDIYRNEKLERERKFRLKKALNDPKISRMIDAEIER